MITKRDCILLLTELESKGVNEVSTYLSTTIKSPNLDLETLRFINKHRPLEASLFYDKLRKSYNNKKSMLYKNIVTCDEQEGTDNVITTLAALNLQVFLYADKVTNRNMFLKHVRSEEINLALLNYSRTFDIVPCLKVLQIVKADLKAFEYLNK